MSSTGDWPGGPADPQWDASTPVRTRRPRGLIVAVIVLGLVLAGVLGQQAWGTYAAARCSQDVATQLQTVAEEMSNPGSSQTAVPFDAGSPEAVAYQRAFSFVLVEAFKAAFSGAGEGEAFGEQIMYQARRTITDTCEYAYLQPIRWRWAGRNQPAATGAAPVTTRATSAPPLPPTPEASASPTEVVSDPPSQSPTPSAAPTSDSPEPSDEPEDPETITDVRFMKSPSGRISCVMDGEASAVQCMVENADWADDSVCDGLGQSVFLDENGAREDCTSGTDYDVVTTMQYGQTIQVGSNIRCTMDRTGLTCVGSGEGGFFTSVEQQYVF